MGLKIIIGFITALTSVVIIFITFFAGGEINSEDLSSLNLVKTGEYNLYENKDGLNFSKNGKKVKDLNFEKLDYFDYMISNKKGNYKINKNKVELKKGKYFIYFSFPKNYEISGNGYNLKIVGPIKIYIDSENQDNLSILPLDNIVKMDLLSLKSNQIKTSVYLYPHTFFSMKYKFNDILGGADFFRVFQVNKSSYINTVLYNENSKIQNVNLDNDFFKSIINYLNNERKVGDEEIKANYDEVKYSYIKKYMFMFVNKGKKISYYKDLIYMNLSKIYLEKKPNNNLYDSTKQYFEELKNLSKRDYEEMLYVLSFFNKRFLLDSDSENLERHKKYNLMVKSIFGDISKTSSNLLLYYTYDSYDYGENTDFFDKIASFSESYLYNDGINIKSNEINLKNSDSNIKMGYYISFLENIIKSYTNVEFSNQGIKSILNVFNTYSFLSANIYKNGEDEKKKTIIALNLNLIKNLGTYIRNNLFKKELEKGLFLVKKPGTDLDKDSLSHLEKGYKRLFDFYDENKTIFNINNENDRIYISKYDKNNLEFKDYIYALVNYGKYKIKKGNLNGNNTNIEIKNNKNSIKEILKYLKYFNGVESSSIKLKKSEDNSYNVSLNINGKRFSFLLIPSIKYTIKNIIIDGTKMNLVYRLDDIKEKYKSSLKEDNNPFKNFFINTFININNNNYKAEKYYNDKNDKKERDSEEVMIYKRDKLLGKRGEFSKFKDFMTIQYDDIKLNINGDNIEIKLKEVEALFDSGDNNVKYGAILDASYKEIDGQKYFDDISIKLIGKNPNGNNIAYLLGDVPINIKGEIKADELKDFLFDITVSQREIITSIYTTLSKEFGDDIKISNNGGKFIMYNFKYKSRNYEIKILKALLVSITENGRKKLKSPKSYKTLSKQINLLIK